MFDILNNNDENKLIDPEYIKFMRVNNKSEIILKQKLLVKDNVIEIFSNYTQI